MKNALKPGALLGLINIVIALLIYIIEPTLMVKWWFGLIILVLNVGLVIYFGLDFRKLNGNVLSFKSAFLYCLTIFVFAGILGTIFNIVLFNIVDVELSTLLADATVQQTEQMMRGFGASEDQIDESLPGLKEDTILRFTILGQLKTFGWTLLFYLVLALIVGAIAKRKRPEFE